MEKDYIEEWKPSSRYPNYHVSSLGNIKNIKSGVIRKQIVSSRYKRININGNSVLIHREVAREFCEGYSEDKFVNHLDGNKLNNRALNLEWVTASQNTIHAIETGLKTYSRTLDDCKMLTLLTLSQVMSDRKASLAVGLSHSALSMIKNGKSYKQYRSML